MRQLFIGFITCILCAACADGAPGIEPDVGLHLRDIGSILGSDPLDTVDLGMADPESETDLAFIDATVAPAEEVDMGQVRDEPPQDRVDPEPSPSGAFHLVHRETVAMEPGTHRPEIRAAADGSLVVAVVHPGPPNDPGGQIKHRVYRMNPDLELQGDPFVITRRIEPYGDPADHRIAIIDDEVVVIYQTLNYREGERPMGGPSEPFAENQSLMLARYSMDGRQLFQAPIIDQTDDFVRDNFPDHCLLWWGDRLLISSGSRSPGVHIREVERDASIQADHWYADARTTLGGNIGNSMHERGDVIGYFSSNSPAGNGALTLTAVDGNFETTRLTELGGDDGLERHFPTDSRMVGDYTLVTYIARPADGGRGIRENPYNPRLMIIDGDYAVVQDIELGVGGFAHVHPTMTIIGDSLYAAWSKRSNERMPQVHIERFTISWDD